MATGDGTPRIYDITDPGDLPSGNFNGGQLQFEISQDPTLSPLVFQFIRRREDLVSVFFDAPLSAPEIAALDAVVAAHDGQSTFPGFQFFEENAVQSIAVENYQNVLTRNSLPLAKGVYIVTWNCEIRVVPAGPLNSAGGGRIQVGGNNKHVFYWPHDEWQTISGWDRSRFDEGEIVELNMQIRRDPTLGGNDAIEVRRLKFGIELRE